MPAFERALRLLGRSGRRPTTSAWSARNKSPAPEKSQFDGSEAARSSASGRPFFHSLARSVRVHAFLDHGKGGAPAVFAAIRDTYQRGLPPQVKVGAGAGTRRRFPLDDSVGRTRRASPETPRGAIVRGNRDADFHAGLARRFCGRRIPRRHVGPHGLQHAGELRPVEIRAPPLRRQLSLERAAVMGQEHPDQPSPESARGAATGSSRDIRERRAREWPAPPLLGRDLPRLVEMSDSSRLETGGKIRRSITFPPCLTFAGSYFCYASSGTEKGTSPGSAICP